MAIQKDFPSHNFDQHSPIQTHYQPIIGILTQPVSVKKKKKYNTPVKNYILEVNESYMRMGGSRTVAIPYDVSSE
jgi:hypothetical protein